MSFEQITLEESEIVLINIKNVTPKIVIHNNKNMQRFVAFEEIVPGCFTVAGRIYILRQNKQL